MARTDVAGEENELYKTSSIVTIDEFTDQYPWVVKDYLWLDGEWDGHITGTVCRNFTGDAKRAL